MSVKDIFEFCPFDIVIVDQYWYVRGISLHCFDSKFLDQSDIDGVESKKLIGDYSQVASAIGYNMIFQQYEYNTLWDVVDLKTNEHLNTRMDGSEFTEIVEDKLAVASYLIDQFNGVNHE